MIDDYVMTDYFINIQNQDGTSGIYFEIIPGQKYYDNFGNL